MKIGIVGLGVVGKACRSGFERLGYSVSVHDIILNTSIEQVLDTEIVYVCVPTPSNESGECNTDIVTSVVANLIDKNYTGVIAIKSTVTPGTTQKLIDTFGDTIVFVPEFLKERSAEYDFVFDHRLLLVGTENVNHYYLVQRSHGDLPKQIMRTSPTEAEFTKYYHNSFNALRVVFANVFYEMTTQLGANYDTVKSAFLAQGNVPDEYLDVKPELRGYAGACLPKDVIALQHFCNTHGLDFDLFATMDRQNNKFKKTVFKGMRL